MNYQAAAELKIDMSEKPPPPPPSQSPGGRPRRPRVAGSQEPSVAAGAPPPPPVRSHRTGSVSSASDIELDDVLDGISLASSTSDRNVVPEQRQRSLSFDDLYALAPVQVPRAPFSQIMLCLASTQNNQAERDGECSY